VIQIDDEQDEDLLLLLDIPWPDQIQFLNISSQGMQFKTQEKQHAQQMTILKHDSIGVLSHHPNRQLASIVRGLYQDLIIELSHFEKCIVAGLT
jgi:hypothetical protein